ncbi:hypothetical protein BX600DRAFT_550408 [Xylariales sp. PMI_506]|nr:hypothetical protein BX600DRAFT_550408 [Xylariales sp. PMI_506]
MASDTFEDDDLDHQVTGQNVEEQNQARPFFRLPNEYSGTPRGRAAALQFRNLFRSHFANGSTPVSDAEDPLRGTSTERAVLDNPDNKADKLTSSIDEQSTGEEGFPTSSETLNPCNVCYHLISREDEVRLLCGHDFHKHCLTQWLEEYVKSGTSYPSCCNIFIAINELGEALGEEIVTKVKDKRLEQETVDKTYCSNPACAKFLKPENISGNLAVCADCHQATCHRCKAQYHVGNCVPNPQDQLVLEIGQHNGWQRCYSCRTLVERQSGCNLIYCLCGARFCYLCGAKHASCHCYEVLDDYDYGSENDGPDE